MKSLPEGIVIKKSKRIVIVQALSLALLLLFACIAITLFFMAFGLGTDLGSFLVFATWGTCLIIWVIGSLLSLNRFNSTNYILSKDALIVKLDGVFGSDTEMYRYDSIISVGIKEGVMGKIFGYSNLIILIPKMEKTVVLKGVVEPLKQAETIKKYINELQPTKIA